MAAIDPAWAGVIGAAIGAAGALCGIPLAHWLKEGRASTLAEVRRSRLRGMLSGQKYTWRSLDALAASIGADHQTTLELLIEIDARASFSNSNSWALVSRAPWPDDLQPQS